MSATPLHQDPSPLAWLRRLPLSREGRFWLLIAAGMLLTGLAKGINLMTLLACFLLAMVGLNVVLARRQLAGLAARRDAADPPFAGRPWRCAVTVANAGRRAAQGVRVEAGPQAWFLPALPPGTERTFPAEIVFPHRGRVAAEPVRVVTGYPFGLARVTREAAGAEEVIVLPAVGAMQRGALQAYLRADGRADGRPARPTAPAAAAQVVFHGLRAYRPGDSRRSIHWRTTARRGELTVREFEDPPGDDLTLVVDATGPADTADERERVITLAATVCWEWCRQTGDRFLLVVAGGSIEVIAGTTGRPLALRLLECLALEPGGPAADPAMVLARLRGAAPPGRPVLVVGGRQSPLAEALRGALGRPVVGLAAGSDKEGKLFAF